MKINRKQWIVIAAVAVAVICTYMFVTRPQHDRAWESGQEVLPRIVMDGEVVRIENVRDFKYQDDGKEKKRYITKDFLLSDITSTDVIISHFSDFEGLAHIFVSFPIGGDEYINISVETRRETNEVFSPWQGVFRKFEIIYVVGMEQDILGVRTDVRGERVYLYPTIATPEQSQELFVALAEDINDIYADPKIYNTIFHNCTNVITDKVEEIADVRFPFTYKMLLPGYVDEILYDMKLISTEDTFEEVKKKHQIQPNGVGRNDPLYSVELRNKED